MAEKRNARDFPKFYYCRHMASGIAGYEDETILVNTDAVKNMLKSLEGKPVYIDHAEVDLDTMKQDAVGYITKSFYNEKDSWAWAKMIITDDEAHDKIANGWSVSNAYNPTDTGDGGTKHNVDYDWEVLEADFSHMAIVQNPRYEEALILTPDQFDEYQKTKAKQLAELKNSKPKGRIMKFFKNKKEEVNTIDEDTLVELENEDGDVEEVSVKDMIDAVLEKNNEEEDEKINMDAEIEVGDNTMPLKDLINEYKNMCEDRDNAKDEDTENADEEDEKENGDDEDKENAEDEDDKENGKDEDDNLENSKKVDHFKELKNAHLNADNEQLIDIGSDMVARGKERY